jgi:hypothetical protein
MEVSIFISYIPINLFISKSVITFSFSPVPTGWLYAFYKLAVLIIFSTLNLILNCLGLKFTIAVYKGLPIKWPLLYISYVPYIPI